MPVRVERSAGRCENVHTYMCACTLIISIYPSIHPNTHTRRTFPPPRQPLLDMLVRRVVHQRVLVLFHRLREVLWLSCLLLLLLLLLLPPLLHGYGWMVGKSADQSAPTINPSHGPTTTRSLPPSLTLTPTSYNKTNPAPALPPLTQSRSPARGRPPPRSGGRSAAACPRCHSGCCGRVWVCGYVCIYGRREI